MKKVIVFLLFLLSAGSMMAAVDYEQYREGMLRSILRNFPDQGDNIYLRIELPSNLPITKEAADQLQGKCFSIVNKNGISSLSMVDRFYLTCKIDVLEKSVIEGMPVRIRQKVRFRFIVCDIVEKKVFEEIHVEGSGIGTNETKAMVACINHINPASADFTTFLNRAKKKIVEFYGLLGTTVLTEANSLAATGEVERAINKLISIPAVSPYFLQCRARAVEIYLDDIDRKAGKIYMEAKNAWAGSPDKEGADKALAILNDMPPISRYSPDVSNLQKEIQKRVTYLEKREWDFKVEQYRDSMRLEMAKLYPPKPKSSGSSSSSSNGDDDSGLALACGMIGCGLIGAAIASVLCPPAAPVLLVL